MKLLAGAPHEKACAGRSLRSYCGVFSSALPEQLVGWENLNPAAATPASYSQSQRALVLQPRTTRQHVGTAMAVNLLVVSACQDEILPWQLRLWCQKAELLLLLLFLFFKLSQSNKRRRM